MVMMMQRIRLNLMKNWLSVHDWPARKPYIRPVSVIVIAYIPAVEPTRIHCQRFDSEFSQFSGQVSVHEWARSTRTRPIRIKMVAPNDEEAITWRVEAPFQGVNNAGKVTEKWIPTKNALRMT